MNSVTTPRIVENEHSFYVVFTVTYGGVEREVKVKINRGDFSTKHYTDKYLDGYFVGNDTEIGNVL